MPPRISSAAPSAVSAVISLTSSTTGASATPCLAQQCHQVARFSATASRPRFTKARRRFRQWINGPGSIFRTHKVPGTNYLWTRDRTPEYCQTHPFPINNYFKSHPVLDERARELIWNKVMQQGEPIKAISAEMGVDITRVAAVVRLKEVEKDWESKGKKLARPYARAVLSMLPTRTFDAFQQKPFEPINELHVHPWTMQQLFWPTSESRHFTRDDAAKAFHKDLLPADKRIPLPELIQMEKELLQGRPPHDAAERFKQQVTLSEQRAAKQQVEKAAEEERLTTRVKTSRFEFRFKQYNSESVGPRGKARSAIGWRYGAPHYDRSKDHQIKIPTSVP